MDMDMDGDGDGDTQPKNNYHVGVVLGSGGHTAEMFRIISSLKGELVPTHFFLCPDDKLAIDLLRRFEEERRGTLKEEFNFVTRTLPRPRKVGQTYFSSIFTTIWTILCCIRAMSYLDIDLLICNGPGVCICVALAGYISSWLRWRRRMKILYIESFARTRKLSLTGRLMTLIADRFLVQWPKLASPPTFIIFVKREFHGLLV